MNLYRRTCLVCLLCAVVLLAGAVDRRLSLLVASAAAEGTVSFEPLDIDLGAVRLRVAHLVVGGARLDKAGLRALLDPKGPLGVVDRLDQLTAATIIATGVTLQSKEAIGAVTLSYKQIALSDVVRGRIGKLAATGGAFGFDAAALKAALSGGLGDLRIDNLDLGLLARSVTQPRQDADEPVRTLVDRAEFDGFHIEAGGSLSVSTGKWSLADVQVRPLLASTRAMPDAFGQTIRGAEEARMVGQAITFVTDVWSSLIVGELEGRDIAVRVERDGGGATYHLSRVHFGGIGRGRFDDMTFEGVGVGIPGGGKFDLARYAVRGLDLGGAAGPASEIVRIAERQRRKTDSANAAEDAKALLSAIADVYDGFSLRSAEIRGLDATAVQGAETTTVSLGRYALSDLSHSRLGDFAVEHLRVATPQGHFALGELSLHGFNYRPTLQVLRLMSSKTPPSVTEVWRDILPTLDQFVLADVDVDTADEKGTGNAEGGKRDVARLGRLEIDAGRFLRSIPTELTARLDHLAVDVPGVTDDALWQRLKALGIAHVDLSARFDLKWDQATKELALQELSIGDPNLGSATLAIEVADVPVEAFTGALPVAEAAWLAAVVKSADLRVVDAGLLDKEIALEAARNHVAADEQRRNLVAAVAAELPRLLGPSPAAAGITQALEAFIRLPKSLHIVARSAEGLSTADFATMKSPDDLLRRLDVRAAADD
jgi:hypothetical protein